ncbi:hypothetical protein ABZ667_04480 [Streptomyces lavendulae]|uniref:hypothetical protein n=1 Tax=Streptomyces lavendulae TaxID=1914 RepID=UPI0033F4EC15
MGKRIGIGQLIRHGMIVFTAAVVLTGCGSAEPVGGSPSKASASPRAAATPTRDVVEADIVAALRQAGVDPAVGGTTAVHGGVKRPDMFDWLARLKTPEAEAARTTAGTELERLGWQRNPAGEGVVLRYRKGNWRLLSSVTGSDALPELQAGDSTLAFTATVLASEGGDADAS